MVLIKDPTTAYATFNLAGKLMGRYDVVGIKGTDSAQLDKSFRVLPGLAPDLQIDVTRPANTRTNSIISMQVYFTNAGNTDITDGSLLINSSNGSPIAFTVEELSDNSSSLQIPLVETNGPPGVLRPSANGTVTVYTMATNALGFNIILPNLD
jgi:hypothetical protein